MQIKRLQMPSRSLRTIGPEEENDDLEENSGD